MEKRDGFSFRPFSFTPEENSWLSEAQDGGDDSSGWAVSCLSTAARLASGESGGVQGMSLSWPGASGPMPTRARSASHHMILTGVSLRTGQGFA